jgi:hypothetical protein
MSSIYSLTDIVGKTLIAKTDIPVYRGSEVPNGQPFAIVSSGQPVGVVDSWLNPGKSGRVNLWFQYLDEFNRPYYTEMKPGFYDVNALKQQGVLTVKQKIDQETIKNQSLPEFVKGNLMKIIYFAGLVIVAKNVLPNLFKK